MYIHCIVSYTQYITTHGLVSSDFDLRTYNRHSSVSCISHRPYIASFWQIVSWLHGRAPPMSSCEDETSGVARAPQAPRPREGLARLEGPARDPPGRSSRRNPLARGPNKLFVDGPENRRYATGRNGRKSHYNIKFLNLDSVLVECD